MIPTDTPSMLRIVTAWIVANLGHAARGRARSLRIQLDDGTINLPIPADGEMSGENNGVDFEPTQTQAEIIKALRAGEMKTDQLVHVTGLSKSQLFERGRGLEQLRAAGLVQHKARSGYFLTEAGERLAALTAD